MPRLKRRSAAPVDALARARRTAAIVESHRHSPWPWWLERQLRPTNAAHVAVGEAGVIENVTGRDWMWVGTVAGPAGIVDPAGAVSVAPGWSLDWWIGAEDRWHLPARETTRQRLAGVAPIVETVLRVPGGEAIHRAYGVVGLDGGPTVAVEIENASAVPFAVAAVLRPADVESVGWIGRIEIDADGASIDSVPALRWSRAPARHAVGRADSDNLVDMVIDGAATTEPHDVECAEGLASAAFIWPLPHQATLRLAAGPCAPTGAGVADLAPSTVVADGWDTIRQQGTVIDLPDEAIAAAWDGSVSTLVLAASGAAPVGLNEWNRADTISAITALAEVGNTTLAAQSLATIVGEIDSIEPDESHELVRCAAALWQLDRADATFASRVGPITVAAHQSAGSASSSELSAVAAGMDAAGQPEVADDVSALAPAPVDETDSADIADSVDIADEAEAPWETIRSMAELARLPGVWPTESHPRLGSGCRGTGHDPRRAAAFVRQVIGAVVSVDADNAVVDLLPDVPADWYGQPIELHRLATEIGFVSVAVRWHGARPALLWEVEAHADVGDVTLRAPGLDPSWSGTGLTGEALLAAPPGAPDPGASFS